jgi:hypothetical protein
MTEPIHQNQYSLFEVVEPLPQDTSSVESTPRVFSDYVVYVDESGDHSLTSIDADYPVFVLALCIFHKRHYSEKIIAAVEKFKFNYFGHDSVVLHEHEIRKQKGAFVFLSQRKVREGFMASLSSIMEASNFVLIAGVVDKQRLNKNEGASSNPYHIALGLCLEALSSFLTEKGQQHLKTHVIFECRGRKEDAELELEFRRIGDLGRLSAAQAQLEIVFANKQTNLTGLQLADLVARPIGLSYLRPHQPNQAFELLRRKFYCSGGRRQLGVDFEGLGLQIYPPHKAKSPDEPTEAIAPTRYPQST